MISDSHNTSKLPSGASRLARGLEALINEAEHRPRTAVETYLLRGFEALLGVRELPPPARQPRKPTLESLLKQADRAGKNVKGAESYPDRTVLQFGEPEPAGSADPWPLDEFRTKETKQ